jgi:acyl-coenzyme A synthetase/AMP-(fatty) acid ligase
MHELDVSSQMEQYDNFDPNDICMIIPTSGSMGEPKIVPIRNKNFFAMQKDEQIYGDTGEINLVGIGIFRGLINTVINAIFGLGKTLMLCDYHLGSFDKKVKNYQPDCFFGVTKDLNLLHELFQKDFSSFSSIKLIYVGGEKITNKKIIDYFIKHQIRVRV